MAPTPPRLEVEELQQPDGSPRLRVSGELDAATAPLLEERLRDACRRHRPVRLDLSELAFIDSAGLQAVLRAVREARFEHVTVAIDPVVSDAVAAMLAGADAKLQLWPGAEVEDGGPDADDVVRHRFAYPSVSEVRGAPLAGPTAHPRTPAPGYGPGRADAAQR